MESKSQDRYALGTVICTTGIRAQLYEKAQAFDFILNQIPIGIAVSSEAALYLMMTARAISLTYV